jgi:hypothetical protein
MSEIVLMKLLDFGLTALSVGLERQAVLDAAKARLDAGDTPEQVADFLVGLRNEAIAKAQAAIN